MYLTLIILPLISSIAAGFFGRKIGVSGAQWVTCTSVIITTLLAILAFFEVGFNGIPVTVKLFRWIDSESLNILWGFNFDSLTVKNDFILNKGRVDAVLVKTQLYRVISVNKLGSGGGFMDNDLGMGYLNTKYQKRYLVHSFLQKRYFSIKSTTDTTQSVFK